MNAAGMDLKNQVFLITGGTSGVGRGTALGLAKVGAKIVIISRSAERGQAALNDIAQATGNDRGEFLVADLSVQSSIRQVADEFKRKYDNLHVLANLSGAAYFDRQLSADGIEMTFAVNYLNHFLLTHELLDMLKASAPSRVITVVGTPRLLGHPKLNFDDLQSEKKFSGLGAAGQALYARMYFAFELANRLKGTGVTSVPFHCGSIKSNLFDTPHVPWYLKLMGPFFGRTAKDICDIAVYLATSKEVENVSGEFFDDKMKLLPLRAKYDDAIGHRLWSVSEALTGVSA